MSLPVAADTVRVSAVRPTATDEELVAITSAMVALWPAPHPPRRADTDRRWRFSGRRWSN